MNVINHVLAETDLVPGAIAAGHRLFSGNSTFLQGVGNLDQLPMTDRVEVCFSGRSNVGKSSLINALTRRRNLARTSNTPGRTRELNFFDLRDSHCLVDLPGYGYARMSRRSHLQISNLARDYLRMRAGLIRVFLLIDARHDPKPVDIEYMEFLTVNAVPFQVVGTKIDKLSATRLESSIASIAETSGRFPASVPGLIMTSARKGLGLELLRATIATLGWQDPAADTE